MDNPSKKSKLKTLTDNINAMYFKLPKVEQIGLARLTIDWGLPVNLAAKLNDANLIKVLAAALTLSN